MNDLLKVFDGKCEAIVTDCYVVTPRNKKVANRLYCKIENAVWDTGATNTVISPEIVDALKLEPLGKSSISAYGGVVEASTYLIDLCFVNGYMIENLEVMSGDYYDYDVLIGMDVITKGDFSVSTVDGKTSFRFHITQTP